MEVGARSLVPGQKRTFLFWFWQVVPLRKNFTYWSK